MTSSEDGAGWLAFFRGLVARGLSWVVLVTSDAHPGLVAAIAATLPGASWQRCRTHYLRDLLTKVAKSSQPWVATLVRTIFDQPDTAEVCAQKKWGRGKVKKQIGSGAGLLFKGSGFYITDYRSENYKKSAKTNAADAKPAPKAERCLR